LAGAEGASTEEYAVNLIKGLRKISKAEIFDQHLINKDIVPKGGVSLVGADGTSV